MAAVNFHTTHHASAGRALHKSGRSDNPDAPEGIEPQQIGIAGHDQIGMALHGQFEELVVRGIAAGGDPLGDRHGFSRNQRLLQLVVRGGRDQQSEIGPCQTSKSCRSVAADLRRMPRCSTICTTKAGRELSFSTVLTKMLVSTTTLSQCAAQFLSEPSSPAGRCRHLSGQRPPPARASRRPRMISRSGSIGSVTRSSELMPRRFNSAAISPAVISITQGPVAIISILAVQPAEPKLRRAVP